MKIYIKQKKKQNNSINNIITLKKYKTKKQKDIKQKNRKYREKLNN